MAQKVPIQLLYGHLRFFYHSSFHKGIVSIISRLLLIIVQHNIDRRIEKSKWLLQKK